MPPYPTTKERKNYVRLCQAIVDLCTDVLRDILYKRVNNPSILGKSLSTCKDILSAGFKSEDWKRINNVTTARPYGSFDLTLFYQTLRVLCIQDLRDALKGHFNPSQIHSAAQNCPALAFDPGTKLTSDEMNVVKDCMSTNSYDDCKDELLWKLYMHLCPASSVLMHPTKPWGQNPDTGAVMLGDDIERIRLMQNKVYDHMPTTEVNEADFNQYWNTLEGVVIRIDTYLSSQYEKALDEIKSSSMDIKAEERYLNQVKKFTEDIPDIEKNVGSVKDKKDQMEGDITCLKTGTGSEKDKQDEIAGDVTGLKTEVGSVKDKQDVMESEVTGLRTGLKTKVCSVKDRQNGVESDVTVLKTKVDSVKGKHDPIEDYATCFRTEVGSVKEKQDQMEDDVTGLRTGIGSVKDKQDEMEGGVTGLKTKVGSGKDKQDEMEGEVTGLRKEIGSVKDKQDEMEGDVTGLRTDIGSVKDKQHAMESLSTEIGSINDKQDEMKGDISGLRTKIGSVKDKQDAMESDVTVLKIEINTCKDQRDDKTDVLGLLTEMDAIKNKQDEMEGDVSCLKTEIDTVKDKQYELKGVVTGLQTKMDKIEKHQEERESVIDSLTANTGKQKEMERDSKQLNIIVKESVPFWTSQRFIVAVFAFFGMFNAFALRSNISLSIVCMVNHTTVKSHDHINTTDNANVSSVIFQSECAWANNSLPQNSSTSTLKDGELLWDRKIQGYVLGSFFWAYSLVQIPSGILVTKFGGKRVFGWSMVLASVITVVTPVASRIHFICAVALRALLGICLGPAYPSIQYLWGRWAPPAERSRLSALSFPGGEVGSMIAFVLAGYLCRYDIDGGWPSTFYLTGVSAFIWAIAWLLLLSDTPQKAKRISLVEKKYITESLRSSLIEERIKTKKIPWKSILTSPKVYAIIVTHFTTDWANYLMLACIPTYIDDVLKFRIEENGLISALPYIPHCMVALLSGWLADFIHSRGLGRGATRKLFNTVAKVIPATLLIGLGYVECTSPITAVTIMTVSIAFRGFRFAGYIVNAVDIAPTYAGLIFGFSNTAGAFAGFLATLTVANVTGNSLREEWQIVFYVTAGIEIFGAIYFVLFASSDVQPWAAQNKEIKIMDEKNTSTMNKNGHRRDDSKIHQKLENSVFAKNQYQNGKASKYNENLTEQKNRK